MGAVTTGRGPFFDAAFHPGGKGEGGVRRGQVPPEPVQEIFHDPSAFQYR